MVEKIENKVKPYYHYIHSADISEEKLRKT